LPWNEVLHKYKHGLLHSGSSKGPKVKNRKQAIAIMLSEKREAKKGKKEYQGIGPSDEDSMIKNSSQRRMK